MRESNDSAKGRGPGAAELDSLIEAALADEAFPCVACGIWIDGKERYLRCAGSADPEMEGVGGGAGSAGGASKASGVGPETLFDAASLTKPLATAPLALLARDSGALDLAAPLGRYLPEINTAAADIPVGALLTHTSGLPAIPAIERAFPGLGGGSAGKTNDRTTGLNGIDTEVRTRAIERSRAIAALLAIEPERPVGESVVYSCTGYMLLGLILERISGQSLGELYRTALAAPLGLPRARFAAGVAADGGPAPIPGAAPPEFCAWRGRRVRGQVHDESAYCFGGQAGNAGLFVSLEDVRRTAAAYLRADADASADACAAAGATAVAASRLSPRSIRDLGEDRTPGLNEARSFGFRMNDGTTFAGPLWPASSFGHTGFTGTSLAIWPERRMIAVVLTNRVYYGREPTMQKMADFRVAFHSIAARKFIDTAFGS
jgi:CubicO group peptidase (beta-lactamase class C family)